MHSVKMQKKISILGEPTVPPYPLPLFFWDYNQSGSPTLPLVWD